MIFNPDICHRRSTRLKNYDYSRLGAYFVTVCTWQREHLLGRIQNGIVELNEYGRVVHDSWLWLGHQYPHIALDYWVVMPNHLHGIIHIIDSFPRRGGSRTAPTRKPLGRLIGAFKTVSTKRINVIRQSPGTPVWQRNYHEHIVRNDDELNRIRQYINDNPQNWDYDPENSTQQDVRRGGSRTALINNNHFLPATLTNETR